MFPSKGSDLNKATTAANPLTLVSFLQGFFFFLAASEQQFEVCRGCSAPGRNQCLEPVKFGQLWSRSSFYSIVFIPHCSSPESLSSRDEASLLDVHLPRFQPSGTLSPPSKASLERFCCESKIGGPDMAEPGHSQDPHGVSWWQLQSWLELPHSHQWAALVLELKTPNI